MTKEAQFEKDLWKDHRTVAVFGPVSAAVHLPAQGARPGVLVAPDPGAAMKFMEDLKNKAS